MGEGEGRNEGEDLFEDLDKFFAPIRDVDWPEETPEPRRPGSEAPPAEPPEPEPQEVGVEREPAVGAPAEPAEAESMEEDIELVSGPTPGQEDLFEAEPAEAEVPSAEEVLEQEEPSGGVASFLFESEAEGYEGEEEISEESFARPPDAYVELPGPASEQDEAVAELVEEVRTAAEEEPPDLEAVEAAAEHFAESVREEVTLEPEAPAATEEVQIAALLGDEVAAEPELEEPEPARPVRVGGEGLGGPSWQEPTALEVGIDHERQGARNVPMAFLTGLVLAGLAVGAIAIGRGPFAIFAGAVVLFAQGEFYLALQKHGYQPATALGLVAGALVLGAGYYRGESAILAVVALSAFATFLWYMTVPVQHRRNVASNIALTVLGVAYVPMLAAYALAVLTLPDGRGLALAIIGLTFAYDTAAFGVGYFWGSRPLAANISPKKSWEGAIGATLVVIAVAVGAVSPYVQVLDTVGRSVGLAVVVAIFAPLGDLAESLLKRDLGVKDMGSILPGHGGVLDRIDSVLFVAPAAFLFLRLILL
ncbi:MAG TPA: phosphatidate cytidylyltransferase [Actinomycetota bacterium]|nr:phosphatidate cytidylyltransferase [Actinomycetota bacterium]